MWLDLPGQLTVGMKVGCPAHYDDPEIVEIVKRDGERVWLMAESGVMLSGEFTRQILMDYDYKLWRDDA